MTLKYLRWQASVITNALKTRRVVMIAGARQCGKTTLSKTLVSPTSLYRTLEV